ncbi:MAG: CCA tRNA nucleotidyltransferase [Bdellovibrionales bacterium]|nr:CCA tRNA nucleotidyltransferase [Bdellovibrionales bacterium]
MSVKVNELFRQLEANSGPDVLAVVRGVSRIADREGVQAYLVGGPVRDLLLGRQLADLDFMMLRTPSQPDDLERFLQSAVAHWRELLPDLPSPSGVRHFPQYLTGKLLFERPLFGAVAAIDFSQARAEVYPRSGAQPEVRPGDLAGDFRRRDFSVNAMAVSLVGEQAGDLVDQVGGCVDLERGCLRILHPRSFEDDPARLLRAVRFAERFGFALELHTAERFAEAVRERFLTRLPRYRLFDEFRKLLEEPESASMVLRLQREGLLSQIHESLVVPEAFEEAVRRGLWNAVPDGALWPVWCTRFIMLCGVTDEQQFRQLLKTLELTRKLRDPLLAARQWWIQQHAS